MTTKCDRCGKPHDGHRICFDCFCELAEEESMKLQTAKYYPSCKINFVNWSTCRHCWPFDCGCVL
jgi:ribosomal protein L32